MPRRSLLPAACRRPGSVAVLAAIGLMIVGAAGASASASAAAAGPAALIDDCLTNGKITGRYPLSVYVQALANLPTDVNEYSDCADVIRRAEQNLAAGGKTAAAAAAATPANPRANPLVSAAPTERAAVTQAQRNGSHEVTLGGAVVQPGVVAARTSSAVSGLPTPLLIALAILLSIALALGGWHARKLVRARRLD